jgi:hypothetical protein
MMRHRGHRATSGWALALLVGVGALASGAPQPTPATRLAVLSVAVPGEASGGLVRFLLSAHCVRALVRAAIACGQVGPSGLAGCGVLLHAAQGACP